MEKKKEWIEVEQEEEEEEEDKERKKGEEWRGISGGEDEGSETGRKT